MKREEEVSLFKIKLIYWSASIIIIGELY